MNSTKIQDYYVIAADTDPDHAWTGDELARKVTELFPGHLQYKIQREKDKDPSCKNEELLKQRACTQIRREFKPEGNFRQEKDKEKYGHGRSVYFLNPESERLSAFSPEEDYQHEAESPTDHREEDLYDAVAEWAKSQGVTAFRIDEKLGSNRRGKNGNRWLYPDLVGWKKLEPPGKNIKFLTRTLMQKCGVPQLQFYSYEVKLRLTRSDVRECYFQAVSNSTWANVSYLIAEEIQEGVLEEVMMLKDMHGIGFVQLHFEDPAGSEILIPATLRNVVGWKMANRLSEENSQFEDFLNKAANACG